MVQAVHPLRYMYPIYAVELVAKQEDSGIVFQSSSSLTRNASTLHISHRRSLSLCGVKHGLSSVKYIINKTKEQASLIAYDAFVEVF